jgi:putative endonuclease
MQNYNFYVTSNPTKTVFYIGVTNNLTRHLQEHEGNKGNKSTFAGKCYYFNLVYYEHFAHIE